MTRPRGPTTPLFGLAWQDTDRPPRREFSYDPHLDPQLVWAGKAERASFEVEAPSIHVHERLSTEAIIRAVRKEPPQLSLFGEEALDPAKAVEFYQHEQGWVNRLILGDSLLVMTSLLEKERLGGQVQMIYIDPPYGINFNSNFQARISNRAPKDGDDALTREPEQVQAFRDTWLLGVHSYLTYLRDRLLLSSDLLSESGSVFVQIGPDRVHQVRAVMDEIFGADNVVTTITVQKTSQVTSKLIPEVVDFILWYARDRRSIEGKYHQLFEDRSENLIGKGPFRHVEINGKRRPMTAEERANPSLLPADARVFRYGDATSQGFSPTKTVEFVFEGKPFHPGPNRHWLLRPEGMEGLARAGHLGVVGNTLSYIRYGDEGGLIRRTNVWTDTGRAGFEQRKKQYIVETNPKIVERCLLMSTDPGDLVVDPTCGSGTTAYAAEKHGRRWITCDTSRVALALARERLLTAHYPFYRLRDELRGIDAGLLYESRPWVIASAIGYEHDGFEDLELYDRPLIDPSRVRVSGPFTVEALSRYAVNPSQEEVPPEPDDPQAAEAQDHLQTLLDALKRQGIPRAGAKAIKIDALDKLASVGPIQAEGTYRANGSEKRFGVSLGPRFGPVTVSMVNEALKEAVGFDLMVFVGFAADPEATKLLGRGQFGRYRVALLEANPDLLVGDLLKHTPSSQTFRLFAAPEAELHPESNGDVRVEVLGIDAFDAATGDVVSRNQNEIAAWFLDQDYDGMVFHVSQAFFPKTGGWEALQGALKGTIDPDLMEQLESFISLPFTPGPNGKAAIRVVDDFGTTSEAVLSLSAR